MSLQHPYSNSAPYPLQPGNPPPQPEPMPRCVVQDGIRYELLVVQQPKRARMCGFGDKDRRPITPPPCVKLIITDVATGKEVDCNDIDHAMYVLNVDLWSDNGGGEVNLVRHSANAPAVSGTIPVSFGQMPPAPHQFIGGSSGPSSSPSSSSPYNPYPGPPNVNPYAQPDNSTYMPGHYPPPPQHQGYTSPTENQPLYNSNGSLSYSHPSNTSAQFFPSTARMPQQQPPQVIESSPTQHYGNYMQMGSTTPQSRGTINQAQPTGMFTRNLIGSLAASAFRLTDPDERIGIWFVLQDLSVRTEGNFRLRFSFVNVGSSTTVPPTTSSTNPTHPPEAAKINTGKAPVLAACFSDVFTVFSAKKFPGVVESTKLSKCFATQGIKIPIRKDGPGGKEKGNREDYDED